MVEWSNERKARLIGALFHDIGKFQYRAGKTNTPHQENSALFISEYLNHHNCLKDCIEEASRLARSHHDPSGDVAIQQADHVAAGEREDEESRQARRPLLSIFTHIQGIRKGITNKTEPQYFLPGPIDYRNIFPLTLEEEQLNDSEQLIGWHQPHWENFLKEVKAIPTNLSFRALADTLLSVLEKWTARVSSAGYKSLPDISLYDHLRTVAAYADCYAEADDKEKPFLVVEADVSGIQNFIYRIANVSEEGEKGTAKTLRGRSFFIGLLTDAVSTYLLKELGLLNVHLLLNGGGGFTIVAPNQQFVREQLPRLQRKINEWLFQEYQGELTLNLVWQAFDAEAFRQFGNIKQEMHILIGEEKLHRLFEHIDDEELWKPKKFDENQVTRVCKWCGNYIGKQEHGICRACRLHKEVGQMLPHTETILFVHSGNLTFNNHHGYLAIPFPALNQTWVLVRESSERSTVYDLIRNVLKEVPSQVEVDMIRLNHTDFLKERFTQFSDFHNAGVGLQFRFVGKYVPKNSHGEVMSFEELAATSQGYPVLGILRMDVDSLGGVFANGFMPEYQTLSRIANLSRLFVLFFNGYINKLAEEHNVYINYSGGDDLFVVGGWTQVMDFALSVQRDFRRFVSGNPHLTISGGMVIVWPSYPIRFAAEQAKEEEDRAKALDAHSPREKNALSIWENPFHWEEVEELLDWAKTVVEFIQKEKDNKIALRSFVRYLKQLYDASFDATGKQDPNWIPKVMHKIHYMLKRRANLGADRIEAPEHEKDLFTRTLARVIHDPRFLQSITLPANYAILKTRKVKS